MHEKCKAKHYAKDDLGVMPKPSTETFDRLFMTLALSLHSMQQVEFFYFKIVLTLFAFAYIDACIHHISLTILRRISSEWCLF